jgi:uncharacterized tellurite resistance protein B-like protein
MVLKSNRTRLKLEYRAASASFRGAATELSVELNLPDVSVLTSATRQLEEIALEVCGELARYSRKVGKSPETAKSFEALVELPISLWPTQFREPLESLREVIERAGQPAAIPFAKLRSWLPAFSEVTRPKLRSLSMSLAGAGLGMEPDVRFGGSAPAADARVVLFARDPKITETEPTPRYLAAALTLHLGVAVMAADGEVADSEKNLLMRQLEEWLHLDNAERQRLHAHLRFLMAQPPKLTGLKAKIDMLDGAARAAVADFLAAVAQADGKATPQEIKTLEKIFKLLRLDASEVFSKLHVAAPEPVTVRGSGVTERDYRIPRPPPSQVEPAKAASPARRGKATKAAGGIQLDPEKVAALQKESERVAVILARVFDSPAPEPEPEEDPVMSDPETTEDAVSKQGSGRLALDARHSAFLEILLTRHQWQRTELEELAEDRALMLDGALERINDAAFERHEAALFEGENPIELNPDVVQEILSGEHETA